MRREERGGEEGDALMDGWMYEPHPCSPPKGGSKGVGQP